MKTSILLLTILALSCAGQAAEKKSKQSVVAANPTLIGKWTGEGKFFGRRRG